MGWELWGEWAARVYLAAAGCCLGVGVLYFLGPRGRGRRWAACAGAGLAVTVGVCTLDALAQHRTRQARMAAAAATPATFPGPSPRGMGAGKTTVGQTAPDFTLRDARSGRQVRLSVARRGRPAVLVFGSFGCDVFCGQLERLRRLHHAFQDRVEFFFVQVRNAPHPLPDRLADAFRRAGVEPASGGDRREQARLGAAVMGIPFPCLVDTPAAEVESLYDAWPERLVIVGADGRVALDAGLGLATGGPVFGNGWNFAAIEDCLRAEGSKPGVGLHPPG